MHIYREISSAQVKSAAATSSPPPPSKVIPAVPTRTSSLHMTDKSRSKVPADLYERYLKSAYNPASDPWISTLSTLPASSSPPKATTEPTTKPSRGFGDFYGGTLRDSLRKLSGRSRSPAVNSANANKIHLNGVDSLSPDELKSPRSTYSVRARSNSFKENNNGWINVGPELAIKPAANNIQPVINVTIVNGHPTSPEPDYHNIGGYLPEKISGNGGVTVQSPGNLRASQFSTTLSRQPRNGAYRGSFREPPSATRYQLNEQYSSSSVLPPPVNSSSPDKTSSRLGSLLSRRSTSLSRGHSPAVASSSLPTPFSVRRPLSPELKPVLKKRPQSQSGLDRKKNVTFSDYTLVYT